MTRYHQNITIDGVDQPAEYRSRKESKFFNEGKWQHFIEPLLPEDPADRTFLEVGCNVGLYLRMAKEYGFRDVVGVEADAEACAMAEQYRDANGMDYRILNRTVGVDFDWDELPAADVVLLSNMHYYIPMAAFLPFLDRMRWKTITCIVVSRHMRQRKHGHPLPDLDAIRIMFRDWEMERVCETSSVMLKNDPHPRHVFSLLFRSRLQRQPMEYHTKTWYDYPHQQELIDIVNSGEAVRLEDTMNWAYWVERKQTQKKDRPRERWTDDEIRAHVQYRLDFVRSIMAEGMKEPILIRPDRIGIDGGNRAQVLRLLGYNSIIVRIV